jgi:hypothetical protein
VSLLPLPSTSLFLFFVEIVGGVASIAVYMVPWCTGTTMLKHVNERIRDVMGKIFVYDTDSPKR